jgi:hypothetical protein
LAKVEAVIDVVVEAAVDVVAGVAIEAGGDRLRITRFASS